MLPCCAACKGVAREGAVQLTCSSLAHFPMNSCETGSISHCGNHHSPQSALSLSFPLSQPRSQGLTPPRGFSEPACAVRRLTSLVVLVDFLFNFLVVGVPCSLILGRFWLFIVFRLIVSYPPFGFARKLRVSIYTSILAGTRFVHSI